MPNLAAFLSYVLITSLTPGPNNIMSLANASRKGFRKSLGFNVGIFLGFIIVMAFCGAFSAALYAWIPTVKPVMTLIGAAYILWLAWNTYKDGPQHGEENVTSNAGTFLSGLLLQFVNPKVIIYGITAFSSFVIPYTRSPIALASSAVLLALVGFLATCCWALFGSVFVRVPVHGRKTINAVMAALLCYCAVSLLL